MADDAGTIEKIDAEPVNSKVQRELYAARKKIFPKRAYGTFRSLKWWVMGITLGIYYIIPKALNFDSAAVPKRPVL